MEDATRYLVSQGVLGVICLGLAVACAHLYRALREEMAARVADAKAFTEQAISLQGRAIDGMHRLADITEAVTKKGAP
jgi:hypothetical protein